MLFLYKIREEHSRVQVNKIYPDSLAEGILREGDVFLSVESKNIDNDGTTEFRTNDKRTLSIKDLVKVVETNEVEYPVFVNSRGKQIVLDREKTEERNELILEKYNIGDDRSGDLKGK